jgi:hypothetical protein
MMTVRDFGYPGKTFSTINIQIDNIIHTMVFMMIAQNLPIFKILFLNEKT